MQRSRHTHYCINIIKYLHIHTHSLSLYIYLCVCVITYKDLSLFRWAWQSIWPCLTALYRVNPIPAAAPRRALKELGPVKHIVSPNFEHVKWAKQWKEVSSAATGSSDLGTRLLALSGILKD